MHGQTLHGEPWVGVLLLHLDAGASICVLVCPGTPAAVLLIYGTCPYSYALLLPLVRMYVDLLASPSVREAAMAFERLIVLEMQLIA